MMPLVPTVSKVEDPKPSLTPEQMKIKAEEPRERARRIKEVEEKLMEREKEMERIRVGKEQAKRIVEGSDIRGMLASQDSYKEIERRSWERVTQRWEALKEEEFQKWLELRCAAAGAAVAAAIKSSAPVMEEKKSSLPIRPATKAEQMRECLRCIKQDNKDDDVKVKTSFDTLLTYTKNVANNPNEEKFRKIRLSNATFQARVGALRGGIEFLELCGFQRFERIDGVKFLFLLRDEVDMEVLNSALCELNNAINNPGFGVL